MERTAHELISQLKEKFIDLTIEHTQIIFVISVGNLQQRVSVTEYYCKNQAEAVKKLTRFLDKLKTFPLFFRIDILTDEEKFSYIEMNERLQAIKRNNYYEFGLRVEGRKRRLFLKEELMGNALLKPDNKHRVGYNLPNLSWNDQNVRGYVNRKYKVIEPSIRYFEQADFYQFKTVGFFFYENSLMDLNELGNGNELRKIDEDQWGKTIDEVIVQGKSYLENQLKETGKFYYGYFPCYQQLFTGYNSVRHFSSLYALSESMDYIGDKKGQEKVKLGLRWGLNNLGKWIGDFFVIQDGAGDSIECKLGAQATAILALSKYTEITKDRAFLPLMNQLVRTVQNKFFSEDGSPIHVLDKQLDMKEKFRIIYYDGELVFSLLRAYQVTKIDDYLQLAKRLMDYFVLNHYEKYHDHWLSYATNEMVKYDQDARYFTFGLANVLNNLSFIEQRDTAYPTMLELLDAAVEMMQSIEKLGKQMELFDSLQSFQETKERIESVMTKRARHEVQTGVMFPEFAAFFKEPQTILNGFYTRHDRFRMRIDDAEHFLSGLIHYQLVNQSKEMMRDVS